MLVVVIVGGFAVHKFHDRIFPPSKTAGAASSAAVYAVTADEDDGVDHWQDDPTYDNTVSYLVENPSLVDLPSSMIHRVRARELGKQGDGLDQWQGDPDFDNTRSFVKANPDLANVPSPIIHRVRARELAGAAPAAQGAQASATVATVAASTSVDAKAQEDKLRDQLIAATSTFEKRQKAFQNAELRLKRAQDAKQAIVLPKRNSESQSLSCFAADLPKGLETSFSRLSTPPNKILDLNLPHAGYTGINHPLSRAWLEGQISG